SSPRPTAPDLDAWGEPQRPTIRVADERPITPYAPAPTHAGDVAQKRLIAGLLAIFLGSLGVHKFYLGMNTQGILILGANIGVWVLALLIGLLTLGFGLFITLPLAGVVSSALGLLGLVEGILYLTKSDADFGRDYLVGKKPWL
ncbi:TM2 domain-containing protein, partial [Deinococcus marmoris]